MLPIVALLLSTMDALALSAPKGWTLDGESRALLSPKAPKKGELIEIFTTSDSQHELAFALMDRGLSPNHSSVTSKNWLSLEFPNRRGFALWAPLAGQGRWVVLLVDPAHLKNINPQSLLISAIQDTGLSPWGESSDGDDGQNSDGGWELEGEEWGRDLDLVGQWSGSVSLRGLSTNIVIILEADGSVRMERSVNKKTSILKGRWMTKDGKLRLHLEGQSIVENYQKMGSTLRFELDQVMVSFYRI